MGDLNTMLLEQTKEDEGTVGPHHIEGTKKASELPDNQRDSRNLLINFCKTNELIVANTFFQKSSDKTCTFKKWGEEYGEPWTTTKYEELKLILTNQRGRNTIQNIESDPLADIHSDHFPVIFKTHIKLKLKKTNLNKS